MFTVYRDNNAKQVKNNIMSVKDCDPDFYAELTENHPV